MPPPSAWQSAVGCSTGESNTLTDAPSLAAQAAALARAGDDAGAAWAFDEALDRYPEDARLANSAGNFHAKARRDARALELFHAALAIDPTLDEARFNASIVLRRLGHPEEALGLLRERESSLGGQSRYWTARGHCERMTGALDDAASSYDRALTTSATDPAALAGRARTSLERGEANAVAAHERALAANPGNPELVHDYAQALFEAGHSEDALAVADMLVQQLPQWPQALELKAGLRWATGDRDAFADHFPSSASQAASPAIHLSWSNALAGVDRQGEAAEVLAEGRKRWEEDRELALAQAIALGESGDGARAENLFADIRFAGSSAGWDTARARNLLRLGECVRAETLLAPVAEANLHDVNAWALRDIGWRLSGDPRHSWLHEQGGLIREFTLELPSLSEVRDCLAELHSRTAMPIGQSVKDGSQTRGALFARCEPDIKAVRHSIEAALADYREGLPPSDPGHPLLAFRDQPWRITGSWSILLDGRGHHASHIHPRGTLSSATYIQVPGGVDDADRSGWLELGRPPVEMRIDLPPMTLVKPREGFGVLFPSTLFHGTRPILGGRRMTVAFDVSA